MSTSRFPVDRSPVSAPPEEERDHLTRDALADVDHGRVFEHSVVLAWVAATAVAVHGHGDQKTDTR